MGDLLAGSDSEGEIKFTINENYASRYKNWREKEVLQKLKDRYGGRSGETDLSTSEDDEDARDLPQLEKGFFKVLSLVKNKDPRLYNENITFYPELGSNSIKTNIEEGKKYVKKKKDKPILLKDYERKLILEKGGMLSDEEEVAETDPRAASPTYVEEQKAIKDSFKHALENSDEEETEGFGSLLKKRTKTESEKRQEEEDYKEWLKGVKSKLKDKDTESDLKVLHDYWNDPNLDSDEVYLRDYILNKRFLEDEDEHFKPAHNEIVHDDDMLENDLKYVNDQEAFEKQYNFRFEEPDPEFIKRYPRSVETSLRKKDDRRKRKRQEIKERKDAEMTTKREHIKQLKALKRKEILEKIEKIKKITGNDDLDFKDEDFEDDFSPEKHDQKMQELFNDEYYGVEETEKPVCPDLDQELDIEDWENWQGKDYDEQYDGYGGEETWEQPQCEDPNFIMDCDYDAKTQMQEELKRISKSKKKQRRKSRFANAIANEKPLFDPSNKKFEEYFEEYYKLDCEDIIGDMPCRFKYRKTTPNDYGLTVDEIMRADVKELNKWCSLKKVVKYKPDHVEKYEIQAYKQKSTNEALKRKILPSLYVSTNNEQDYENVIEEMKDQNNKKKKKKMNAKAEQDSNMEFQSMRNNQEYEMITEEVQDHTKKKKKSKKYSESEQDSNVFESTCNGQDHENITEVKDESKKKKKKKKYVETEQDPSMEFKSSQIENQSQFGTETNEKSKNTKKKKRKFLEHLEDKIQLGSSEKKQKIDDANYFTSNSTQKKSKRERMEETNNKTNFVNGTDVITFQEQTWKDEHKAFHKKSVVNNHYHRHKSHNQMGKKRNNDPESSTTVPISDVRLKAYGIHPKKFKNKIKYGSAQNAWRNPPERK